MLSFDTIFKLLSPKTYFKANYALHQDRLYSNNKVTIDHERIQFFRKSLKINSKLKFVDFQGETFYLLLIYSDNIAHFFHDVFFPLYYEWRINKKRICVSIDGNKFQREFLESLIGKEYLVFLDRDTVYLFSSLILTPSGRDLKIYPDYISVCKEIKYICLSRNNIIENRTKNLLYARSELARKKLLYVDKTFLETTNIKEVFLSKLNFIDYLQTLASAQTLTYVVGAGVFNLLFLDDKVDVLEINPHRNNSWAQMFGLSHLCRFNVLVCHRLEPSVAATQDDPILDSHVCFDDNIADAMTHLVGGSVRNAD